MSADCGATYDHAPHLYRTPRGKVKACDGSVSKRPPRIASVAPIAPVGARHGLT